jgi:hypothetical protein
MGEHLTSKKRDVKHDHFDPNLHAADQEIAKRFMAELFKQAVVVKEATLAYNCHGFALAPTHLAWYSFPDLILTDNYTGTPMDSPQIGDVLIYSKSALITHSALVIKINGSKIEQVQSKWGGVAEVKHPPGHVPDVYGEPIVLLRPLPEVGKHPVVVEAEKAATAAKETGGADGVADSDGGAVISVEGVAEAATLSDTTETTEQSVEVPERFMLMLASTPEVRRRILESGTSARASGGGISESLPVADTLEAAPSDESTQADIENALKELAAESTQFHLMLASSPDVLRLAAAELPPVKALIRFGQTNPEAGKAVLELFEKPETQDDEQITGIALFLLSKLPVQTAVAPIARYLQTRKFSSFNGALAIEALRAAVTNISA